MKKIKFKKILAYILVGSICFSLVSGSYSKARTSQAVSIALPGSVALALALLSTYGITIASTDFTDGSSARQITDDVENAYKKQFTLMNGGNSDPNDPNDWNNLSESFVQTGSLFLSGAILEYIAPYLIGISALAYNRGGEFAEYFNNPEMPDIVLRNDFLSDALGFDVSFGCKSYITSSTYVSQFQSLLDSNQLLSSGYSKTTNTSYKDKHFIYKSLYRITSDSAIIVRFDDSTMDNINSIGFNVDGGSSITSRTYPLLWDVGSDLMSGGNASTGFYYNVFSSPQSVVLNPLLKIKFWDLDSKSWINTGNDYQSLIHGHPDLANLPKDNLVAFPPFATNGDTLNLPTLALQQALQNGLLNPDLTPDEKKDLINNYLGKINPSLGTDPNPNPDPNPDPDPDGGGDGGGDPDGGGGGSGGDQDGSSIKPLLADLSKLFPFCIPFDLINAFKLLLKDPVAPKWSLPLKVPQIGLDYELELDMARFEELAKIFRSLETVGFVVALILVTRGLIKG